MIKDDRSNDVRIVDFGMGSGLGIVKYEVEWGD